MKKTWQLMIGLGLSCLLTACPQKKSSEPTVDAKAMALDDVAKMQDLGTVGYNTFTPYRNPNQLTGMSDLFADVFGGHEGMDIRNYLDTRLHYYFSEADFNTATLVSSIFAPAADMEAVIHATNLGLAIWLDGVLSNSWHRINVAGESILVDDPRVGIMMIGPGYTTRGQVLRQGTLVHEARHSDCTGGYSAAEFAELARTQDISAIEDHTCGHMHIECPQGHPFEGLPACDDHAWGAYSIGYVYAAGISDSVDDYLLRSELEADAADSLDRVMIDVDAMIVGDLGAPDMSSTPVAR